MSHPESSHPWNDHPRNKPIRGTKDTRQHSPCRRCFADCLSSETTAILTFTCTNCGHQHTTTRGDSIRHSGYLARLTTGRAE